ALLCEYVSCSNNMVMGREWRRRGDERYASKRHYASSARSCKFRFIDPFTASSRSIVRCQKYAVFFKYPPFRTKRWPRRNGRDIVAMNDPGHRWAQSPPAAVPSEEVLD